MTEKKNQKAVYVAMSGGVDSSVAAALLKDAGYAVRGVFIRTWQPEFLPCTWREERSDAVRVAALLGIPFETLDLSEEYRRAVVDYMIEEYRAGRTPNPDIVCNQTIKFGSFFRYAIENGAHYIATGHYARVARVNLNDKYQMSKLLAGKDENKDQSYFLWILSQAVLAKTLFPVGEYTKPQVRELAKKFGLHVAEKKDSQGVCFLGKIDLEEFLSHYIPLHPGVVVNTSGAAVGEHRGVRYYTLGQRHGFEVVSKAPTDGPYYVVAKDIPNNTLMVSPDEKVRSEFGAKEITLSHVNWISDKPKEEKKYSARIRYRQPLQFSRIAECQNPDDPDLLSANRGSSIPNYRGRDKCLKVIFDEKQKAATPGQSCVLYDSDVCLGGGVIL